MKTREQTKRHKLKLQENTKTKLVLM